MDTLDFLRQLRQRNLSVPAVVVTGRGDETTAVAALKLGAYDYICKREGYLTQVPYAIDNAIDRFHLTQLNRRLQAELAERERAEAERARLSEQLQQAQKIESLGRLAGGVAHDFNNLLTVITGHADLLLERLAPDAPLRENVKNMIAATKRASDLTRQLLAFSRRQVLQPRVMDLNESIRESTSMLSRLLSEPIELVTILDPDLGHVKADPSQLNQLLVNLAVNARDAMPRGGRLTIETHNVGSDEQEAQRHSSRPPGNYVVLAVSDTGIGIDNDVLPHIFEPFFTTKEHGKGTGLGLSTVYGIVQQSGGWLWVDSEVGRGTTFKIYLPRVEGAVTVIGPPPALDNPRGDETVLVVEDQQEVRSLMRHVLGTHGYDVIEAPEGRAAVEACEAVARPISLLITDVVMNAIDFLREAKQGTRVPPFIVITGKGDEEAAVAALKLGASDYMVKRENYLTQLPYAIENAISRAQLVHANQRLQTELLERERAEARVRQLNTILEERVVQRTRELEAAHQELEETTILELIAQDAPLTEICGRLASLLAVRTNASVSINTFSPADRFRTASHSGAMASEPDGVEDSHRQTAFAIAKPDGTIATAPTLHLAGAHLLDTLVAAEQQPSHHDFFPLRDAVGAVIGEDAPDDLSQQR